MKDGWDLEAGNMHAGEFTGAYRFETNQDSHYRCGNHVTTTGKAVGVARAVIIYIKDCAGLKIEADKVRCRNEKQQERCQSN